MYSSKAGTANKEDQSTKKGLLIGDVVVPPSNPDFPWVPVVVVGGVFAWLLLR